MVRCLSFRGLEFGFHIRLFGLQISDLSFLLLDLRYFDFDMRFAKINVGYCSCVSRFME